MTYYCPTNQRLESCKIGFATIAAMEQHIIDAHPEYDYDEERIEEEPTAE